MWSREPGGAESSYIPAMDIYEKGDSLFIEVDLPGVKKESIQVSILNCLIKIEGRKNEIAISSENPGKRRTNFLQLERKFGSFMREIELPSACNTSEISATYENGILKIEVKRVRDMRAEQRKIKVE